MNMRPCVTPEAIATVARAAEEAGFESFWGGEHLALADPQTPASPMPPRIDFVDLNVTMAFAAAQTRTLRFGTGIMILPLRNPVILAKQLASVDVVSGGRLIFGIGIGNLEFEFNAVGMPFDHKGLRAEEALAAMKALWTMSRAEFRGHYFSLCFPQNRGHVGEVVFAVRVGGGEMCDVLVEVRDCEDVKARVDFVDFLLRGARGFFLDDGFDFRAGRAFAENASVAGGILKVRAEQSHGGARLQMEVTQAGDGFRGDEWRIAGEHDHVIVTGQSWLRHHERVAGAALLGLQHESDARFLGCGAHERGFMTDDDEHVRRGGYSGCRADYVRQEGLSADFM